MPQDGFAEIRFQSGICFRRIQETEVASVMRMV
jgi:hypothetical protein